MSYQFSDDAFLASDRDSLIADVRDVCPDIFTRAEALNRDLHWCLFRFKVRNGDPQQLLVAAAATRTLELFQAAVILFERGMVSPGKVTTRALLEAVFTVRALVLKESLVKPFIASDSAYRRRLVNKIRNNPYPLLDSARAAMTDEAIQELDAEIQEHNARSIKVEELSRAAEMHDWYLTAYTLLSQPAHTTVREMDSYLSLGPDEEIRFLQYGPSVEEIPQLLLTACHVALLGISSAAELFEQPLIEKQGHLEFFQAKESELPEPGSSRSPIIAAEK